MIRLVLLRFLESYFRHRWLYFVPILLMTAFAIVYYLMLTPVYVAQGVFFVQQESFLSSITSLRESGYSWETPAQSTVNEFRELLQTDAFVRSVIGKTDIEQGMDQSEEVVDIIFQQLRESLWLSTLGNNQIRIAAENEDPIIAQQLVNASFDTYLQWKINIDQNEGQFAAEFLVSLVDGYKVDVDAARQTLVNYLLTHPQPLRGDRSTIEQLEIDRLQAEVNLAEERYSNALDKDEDAQLALAQAENAIRQTYYLIDAPTIPTKPGTSLRDIAKNMILFVIVGVVISVIAIAGGALLDRSIRFPIDVHHVLHLSVLTEVPDATPKKSFWKRSRKSEQVVTLLAVDSDTQSETNLARKDKAGINREPVV